MAFCRSFYLLCFVIVTVSSGPINFQKRDTQSSNEIVNSLNYALESFNFMNKEDYLFKVLSYQSQMIQIMNGIEYIFNAEVGRTQCKKTDNIDIADCTLIELPGQMQVLSCHFVVLNWQSRSILLQSVCKNKGT
ncbi:cystatin-like [Polypterus senegalus]